VRLQRGQSERVERQDVLSVFGLAIRLDDPAIYDDAGYLDRESPGVQVEQVTAGARQLAAPHARSGFEHPQGEEPVRPRALQESLKLSHRPDLAALARHPRKMCVTDDIPLGPSPYRKVLPGPVKHAVRVHNRLGLQARRQLALCRLGGVFSRPATEFPGLDRAAYRRIILGVRPVTPHDVIAVRPTRQRPTI
jgi:hypothetical protein